MCNYIIGYDVINSIFEGPKRPEVLVQRGSLGKELCC